MKIKWKKNSSSYSLAQRGSFSGLLRDERGVVAIVVALLLVVLIGFAGLVVDLGYLFVIDSSLQTAADSASLAATASLSYGPDEARVQAQLLAQQHGILGSPVALKLSDIELGNWDKGTKTFTVLAPDQEANADSVRVTAQRSAARNNPISLFFMRIFGHVTSDVGVISVAYNQTGLCGAIIGVKEVNLNSSATTDSYDTGVYSPANAKDNGDVCSCGDISLNSSASVNGDATPGDGHEVILNSSAYVTGSTDPGGCPVLADIDFGDVATNNDNGNIGLTDDGEDPFPDGRSKAEFELNNSDSLTLPGGTYYFSSFSLNSSSTLTFTGPTVLYITGSFNVNSSNIVNETQIPENLIIMVSSNDVKVNSDVDFHGVIYAPNAHAFINSNSDIYGAIIADAVSFDSSTKIHYDEALDKNAFLNSLVNTGALAGLSSVLVQ